MICSIDDIKETAAIAEKEIGHELSIKDTGRKKELYCDGVPVIKTGGALEMFRALQGIMIGYKLKGSRAAGAHAAKR